MKEIITKQKDNLLIGIKCLQMMRLTRLNFQNMQIAHTTQHQKKTKPLNPNTWAKGLNRHFFKEDTQVVKKGHEKVLNIANYSIGEMQMKTTVISHRSE